MLLRSIPFVPFVYSIRKMLWSLTLVPQHNPCQFLSIIQLFLLLKTQSYEASKRPPWTIQIYQPVQEIMHLCFVKVMAASWKPRALWRNVTITSESSDLKKFSGIRGGHFREWKCRFSGSQSSLIFSSTLSNVVHRVGVWVESAVYWDSSRSQNC